jgi:hypothetical protein
MASVIKLEEVPRPAGLAFAGSALMPGASVSVRRGGFRTRTRATSTSTVNRRLVGTVYVADEVKAAPTLEMRVFVDVRHAGGTVREDVEPEHLAALELLLAAHAPRSTVVIGSASDSSGIIFECDTVDAIASGDVFITTLTGVLVFDHLEGAKLTTSPTFEHLELRMKNGVDLTTPTIETVTL